MPVKDYYKILELSPGADPAAIKKNFRKLALRFHPDTNQGNEYAAAWFRELQEAYDTLSDPVKKDAYLQLRWLNQTQGKAMVMPVVLTPDTIAAEARALANRVAGLDHFRMDHAQLAENLENFLTDDRLQVLQQYKATQQQYTIGVLLLQAAAPVSFALLAGFYARMQLLAIHVPTLQTALHLHQQGKKWQHLWQVHQWWIILAATLLLCILIASFSH